jgi:hypothetical protein
VQRAGAPVRLNSRKFNIIAKGKCEVNRSVLGPKTGDLWALGNIVVVPSCRPFSPEVMARGEWADAASVELLE